MPARLCDMDRREGTQMANCVVCGASNLGGAHERLVIVDNQWYCEDCLAKKKGHVRCAKCGKEPFKSDEHFKTVDGQYMCTDCMEKAGIIKKYDYIMQSFGAGRAAAAQSAAASSTVAKTLGGLQLLLDQNVDPGEVVTFSIQGNAGEALACSKSHVFVLKSGLAVGSITGRKCSKYPWSEVRNIEMRLGTLYGILEVSSEKLPVNDPNDIARAKKSDNAITFLLSRKAEFEQALTSIKGFLHS